MCFQPAVCSLFLVESTNRRDCGTRETTNRRVWNRESTSRHYRATRKNTNASECGLRKSLLKRPANGSGFAKQLGLVVLSLVPLLALHLFQLLKHYVMSRIAVSDKCENTLIISNAGGVFSSQICGPCQCSGTNKITSMILQKQNKTKQKHLVSRNGEQFLRFLF